MRISVFGASLNRRAALGLTLIEVVVTVGIVIILSGIMVGYSRNASKSLDLVQKEAELLGLLFYSKSLSQNFALEVPSGQIVCAYGVHVDSANKHIFIFQDRVSNLSSCNASDNVYTVGEELFGEENNLHLGERLAFGLSADPSSPDLVNVVFIPPDPDIIINNNVSTKSGSIVVGIEDESSNFTVKVNNLGQISAD